jgi:UDP-N-acetylglucosamine/UDP-N-acetylgalactosamine 4-epimerase
LNFGDYSLTAYERVCTQLRLSPKIWLITGVAGFIGSHLLETLLKLNQRVIGLDNFSTGYQKNLDEVSCTVSSSQWKNFYFFNGDICNIEDCRNALYWPAFNSEVVNYVLHQAALGSVPRSIENPLDTNKNNIDGFLNVITASRDVGVQRFVYAASSSTYGDHPGLPKIEDKIGNPLSPYAITKYVNELYADVFFRLYGFESVGLRYFNVFGPRQDPFGSYAAVIPKWISAILSKSPVFINGDGATTRDFCYVDNVVQANLLAAVIDNNNIGRQIYNVAAGEQTSLYEIFQKIRTVIIERKILADIPEPILREFRIGDIRHSRADIKKIVECIGYEPSHNVLMGIERSITWYADKMLDMIKHEKN